MDKPQAMKKKGEKKPFDKKKWRERKYSNKMKVQRFEEKRKRTVLREYYKELKATNPTALPTYRKPEENSSADTTQERTKKKRPSAMYQARLQFEQQKEEKKQKREELQKKKEEREEALREYRAKKAERFKKLSKKTKKGQPVMKDRLEMLLEKIQRQCAKE